MDFWYFIAYKAVPALMIFAAGCILLGFLLSVTSDE